MLEGNLARKIEFDERPLAGISPLRILFAGGGTGGHIYMAVALARRLRRIDPAHQFLFVGTPRGLEERILSPLGFEWTTIQVGGLNRVGWRKAARSLSAIPASLLASRRILSQFRPHLMIGLGGYSSGPVALAARWMKVPSLLIEPNVEPGLTNRILGRWADGVAVAFEETRQRFGARARLTGIPVREEFSRILAGVRQEGPLRLLVFGGSQGSRPLNDFMTGAMQHLSPHQLQVCHQTGQADFERVKDAYAKGSFPAQIMPYIDDMPQAFGRADLVLSRAGASTVAEIAAAGRPSLLVPFPQAADDHQRKNALALAQHGAGILLEQSSLTPRKLAEAIRELEQDRQRLQAMSDAARGLAHPDSVDRILKLIGFLARPRT